MKKYSQYHYLKTLLAIILISSSIVGCQALRREDKKNINSPDQVEVVEEEKSNLTQSLEELNNKLNTFEQEKKAFISELENVIQYKDNKAELELVNSNNLFQSFKDLQSANNELSSQHLSKFPENKIQLEDLHNSLNKSLEIIEPIITPAKDGLKENSIKKIQAQIYSSPQREKPVKKETWYGQYGKGTKDKIVENLNKHNLKKQTSDLTKIYSTAANIIQPEEGANESSNSSSIEDWGNNITEEKIQSLNNQIEKLQKDIEQIKSSKTGFLPNLATGFLGAILALVLIFTLRDILNRLRKRKKTLPSRDPVASSNSRNNHHEDEQGNNKSNNDNLIQEIERLKQDNDELYGEHIKLNDAFTKLNNRLEEVEQKKTDSAYSSKSDSRPYSTEPKYTPQSKRQSRQPPIAPSYDPPAREPSTTSNYSNPQLVETYNRHSRSLLRNATEVSETQNSISDRSLGKGTTVILENKNRGIYAVVPEGNTIYLVPSNSFRITDGNLTTVQASFECRRYQKGYSERFNLSRPAIVIPLSGGQWQLQERGILEF